MEADISLSEFIAKVKEELVVSQCEPQKAFFELTDVELEVTFALSVSGEAKSNLVIVKLGGGASTSHTHRAKLKFKPLRNKYNGLGTPGDDFIPFKIAEDTRAVGHGWGPIYEYSVHVDDPEVQKENVKNK